MKNQEYYEKQYSQNRCIYEVPEEYRTREMYEDHYRLTGDITIIPQEYLAPEMYYQALYNENRNITEIPEEYRTDFMYEMELKKTKNLEVIPPKRRTKRIYRIYFELTHDITKIPEKFITERMRENMNQNQEQTIRRKLETATNIIKALGPIQNGLTKQQKILFTYNIFRHGINSLEELYLMANFYKNDYPVATFLKENFQIKPNKENPGLITIEGDWFQEYDIENHFQNKTIPINGKVISKQIVTRILNTMKTNQIPQREILVNMAIESYLNGDKDLKEYTDILKMFEIAEIEQVKRHTYERSQRNERR